MKTVAIPDASLNARKIRRVHLFELQAGAGSSTYYRFTDNNLGNIVNPTIGDGVNRTFIRQFFTLSQVSASIDGDENTEVTFLDINDAIRTIAHSYNIVRWPVKIWEYWPADDKAELLIEGQADGIDLPDEGDSKRAVLGITSETFDYGGPGLREYDPEDFPYAPAPGAKFAWGPYTEIVNSRPVWQATID